MKQLSKKIVKPLKSKKGLFYEGLDVTCFVEENRYFFVFVENNELVMRSLSQEDYVYIFGWNQ